MADPTEMSHDHHPIPRDTHTTTVPPPDPTSTAPDTTNPMLPPPITLPANQPAHQTPHSDSDGEEASSADSAYGEDSILGDDTTTLASYVTNYQYENGRRYHAFRDGAYWGPNDDPANDVVDLAHHMYLITLDGRLHLAPLTAPQEILDVGTGTGIWAIDCADRWPGARVVGVDLSPIQPDWVPVNCGFEIDDVTAPWTWPRDHFDFVHVRKMFGSIPDWDALLAQCFAHVKPGGWVELVEHSVEPVSDDGTVGEGHFYKRWGETVMALGEMTGKGFGIWREAKGRMERAGFEEVVEWRFKWPMNGWSAEPKMRELGKWNQLRLYDGVEGFMIRLLTAVAGWSYAKAQLFLAEMRKSLRDYDTHAYLEGSVVYGRKPFR